MEINAHSPPDFYLPVRAAVPARPVLFLISMKIVRAPDFNGNAIPALLMQIRERKNRKGIIIYITTCGSGTSGERA